jgi:hypothetical protein
MQTQFLRLAIWLVVSCSAASATLAVQDTTGMKSRSFEFKYGATITEVPKGASVRVWFPIAEENRQQKVTRISADTPVGMQVNRDQDYNNLIGYFELKSENGDDVKFGVSYDVVRYEAGVDDSAKMLTPEQRKLFLSANSLVPIEGKPLELIKGISFPDDAMEVGHSLYNVVDEHLKYDKSKPGYGDGNVLWACDSKTGNCTDFHSLFISLARSRSVPARFEIGFPVPSDSKEGEIGGYHCWAWFHVEGKGWAPVDISEADKHPEMKDYYFGKLTTDRVSISSGRDIVLVPKSESGPINYFVYPHVEVDGKPWSKEKIQLDFSFREQ